MVSKKDYKLVLKYLKEALKIKNLEPITKSEILNNIGAAYAY